MYGTVPIPVAARSMARVCGRSLAWILGSNCRGLSGVRVVLSGSGLCVGPITRPEECGVFECDLETSIMIGPCPTMGCFAM